jgi:hypothetical protein
MRSVRKAHPDRRSHHRGDGRRGRLRGGAAGTGERGHTDREGHADDELGDDDRDEDLDCLTQEAPRRRPQGGRETDRADSHEQVDERRPDDELHPQHEGGEHRDEAEDHGREAGGGAARGGPETGKLRRRISLLIRTGSKS